MDVEFHYYMTYLTATRAGLDSEDAAVLAYASQYVDDNNVKIAVGVDTADLYRNYISQTMDILKPKKKLFRIYPLFHFIPGDLMADTSLRKDGTRHLLNTTPNSKNAQAMMDAAINTKNLYRMGIACHAYADTWAHQNFIGYFDGYNSMAGMLEKIVPDIGHAKAFHNPDRPAAEWEDHRLLGPHVKVNNKDRFMDAARHMYEQLCKYRGETATRTDADALVADLKTAIGEPDNENEFSGSRIERYKALGEKREYGGKAVPEYVHLEWFHDAIKQDKHGGDDMKPSLVGSVPVLRKIHFKDEFYWRNEATCKESHWFQFQEAVKAHQNHMWQMLEGSVFNQMDLESL